MPSDIKWIKITTDMFDDEKIKLIEAMPDADTLLVIWVKLLCQAGKTNAGGYIFLSENIPFNEEDLATIFNRPVNTIRLALSVLTKLQMIVVNDDGIYLPKWEKHQNIEGMERIRQLGAERQHRFRQKHQRLALPEAVTLRDVTVTQQNKIKNKIYNRLDKDIDDEKIIKFINYSLSLGYTLENIPDKDAVIYSLEKKNPIRANKERLEKLLAAYKELEE